MCVYVGVCVCVCVCLHVCVLNDGTIKFCFAELLQICCSSVSLFTNMYSHVDQILVLECRFGGNETQPMHARYFFLSLSLSLSLCLSL